MHDLTIIITLAGGLAVALVFGWITQRLGLSTLVGYLMAGIAVGPYTPGFVADAKLAAQMAEIGVILLLFGVGMHFHPQELLRVRRVAIPGAVAQSAVAAVAGWVAARAFGWSDVAGVVFGMSLAVASTVVLMRMLVERDRLGTHDGHVAVGWLIVEDIFTVVALVVLPALAAGATGAGELSLEIALAVGKAGLFAAAVWVLGMHVLKPVMERIARAESAELFTLSVFVIALGVALLAAKVFDVSVALGAFFAGLVIGQSRFGPQAAAEMAPFRDVFSALFFVSIGMLFNPAFVLQQPLMVLAALAIILIAKPLVALIIVFALRDTPRTALTVAVGLAQIGEFSFILAALGRSLDILPPDAFNVIVVAAIVSIALNPLLFRVMPAIERRFFGRPRDDVRDMPPPSAPAATAPVVLAGLNELGQRIAAQCAKAGVPLCVIDQRLDRLEELRARGVSTVYGHAARTDVLTAAGVASAKALIVTEGSLADKLNVCQNARALNPRIALIAAVDSESERAWLHEFGATYVCDALDEVSEAMLRAIRNAL